MGRNRKSARTVIEQPMPQVADDLFFNPRTLPVPLQEFLNASYARILSAVRNGVLVGLGPTYPEILRATRNGVPIGLEYTLDEFVQMIKRLGLDPNNDDDLRTYADLISLSPGNQLVWKPTIEEAESFVRNNPEARGGFVATQQVENPLWQQMHTEYKTERQNIELSDTLTRDQKRRKINRLFQKWRENEPERYIATAVKSLPYDNGATRDVLIFPDRIEISNESFKTSSWAPPGLGYLMIARQLNAARKIADRTGKNVRIETGAVSGGNPRVNRNSAGLHVWPKLGYVFSIPPEIKYELRQLGFTDAQMKDTATLMLSTNPSGQTGFDVWEGAVTRGFPDGGSATGYTVITPQSARSRNPSELSLAEQVTLAYGKRRGFVKQAATANYLRGFLSDNDAQDEIILRGIWRDITKQNKG